MTNEYGEPLDRNGYASSVFSDEPVCWYRDHDTRPATSCYCGSTDAVRHEIFHADMSGTLRSRSKEYGAWLYLCPVHHGHVHNYPQFYKPLQAEAQRRVMDQYGWDIDAFRARFEKNYL